MGIVTSYEEDRVIVPKPGDVWEFSWRGSIGYYLVLEAVDFDDRHLYEHEFWMLDLGNGQTMYLHCDGEPDDSIWQRIG